MEKSLCRKMFALSVTFLSLFSASAHAGGNSYDMNVTGNDGTSYSVRFDTPIKTPIILDSMKNTPYNDRCRQAKDGKTEHSFAIERTGFVVRLSQNGFRQILIDVTRIESEFEEFSGTSDMSCKLSLPHEERRSDKKTFNDEGTGQEFTFDMQNSGKQGNVLKIRLVPVRTENVIDFSGRAVQ